MPNTSVVILNYNGRDFLLRFLPSLIKHTPTAEIVVADNCSTDDSLTILEQFPQVKKIVLPENYGYAGGYNEALKRINSSYYLLLNSDIEVSSGWLEPLEAFLNSHTEYAAVQPKILDYIRKEFFEYAGGSGGYLDMLGYPYCRGRIFDTVEEDTGQYDNIQDVFWCSGACFLIRSDVFFSTGGFDPDFFAHMEEIDLCWRLHSHGYRMAIIPESTVYHVGGGTLAKSNPQKTYLNFRNNINLLIKNLPISRLMLVFPIRFALDMLAALKFWKDLSFEHTRSVWKAWRHVLANCRKNFRKRKLTSLPLIAGEKKKWVLKDYFLYKKKRYSELSNTK